MLLSYQYEYLLLSLNRHHLHFRICVATWAKSLEREQMGTCKTVQTKTVTGLHHSEGKRLLLP
uniref:Uncharacterized protein n=1 Tax=Rhizophora mucronata TaxID=61149 RepID=A0A2P2QLS9_RHIMU